MKKILINFLYYNPVGHVVEALKYAKGYKDANLNIEIHIALNKYSPTELAQNLPWLKAVYPIDILEAGQKGEKAKTFKQIPREWDYILIDDRPALEVSRLSKGEWPKLTRKRKANLEGLISSYEAIQKLLSARTGTFPVWTPPRGLKYTKNTSLSLSLPSRAKQFVKNNYSFSGTKIGIMLGGSKHSVAYPSIRTWAKIIKAINRQFPNSKIYITGVTKKQPGRTSTRSFGKKDLDYLFRRFDNLADCYDIGLWNQVALLKHCDVFLSPHTGFAFLAPAVNTPWLALSGGNWAEYFFNQVPFYSVLPDDPNFPYRNRIPKLFYRFKRSGKILPMQADRLEKKIPEIIHGLLLLMDPGFTYRKAMATYRKNVAQANVAKEYIVTAPKF